MRFDHLSFLLVLVGCGEWVAYDGTPPAGPGGGTLDEATQRRLATVTRFDHLAFDQVLARHTARADAEYVLFDYRGLLADGETALVLEQYLAAIAVLKAGQLEGTEQRLAYWINAYNATVIAGVLAQLPTKSDYQVSEENFVFFDLPNGRYGGEALSLNQVEHGVIRGDEAHASFIASDDATREVMRRLHQELWGADPVDARIHVALNCAARSCPNLRDRAPYAYRAAGLAEQLDQQARAFAASPNKGAGPEGISVLFESYALDWERTFGSATNFLKNHREEGLNGINIDRFLPYDWTLNIVVP